MARGPSRFCTLTLGRRTLHVLALLLCAAHCAGCSPSCFSKVVIDAKLPAVSTPSSQPPLSRLPIIPVGQQVQLVVVDNRASSDTDNIGIGRFPKVHVSKAQLTEFLSMVITDHYRESGVVVLSSLVGPNGRRAEIDRSVVLTVKSAEIEYQWPGKDTWVVKLEVKSLDSTGKVVSAQEYEGACDNAYAYPSDEEVRGDVCGTNEEVEDYTARRLTAATLNALSNDPLSCAGRSVGVVPIRSNRQTGAHGW